VLDVRLRRRIARPREIKTREQTVALQFFERIFVKIIAVFVLRPEEEPVLSFRLGRFAHSSATLVKSPASELEMARVFHGPFARTNCGSPQPSPETGSSACKVQASVADLT